MGVTLTSRLPQIVAEMRPKAAQVVQKTAHDVESVAKQYAPVDTGYLRSSIQAQSTGELSAEVTVGADYGIYQEYGTYKMAAQPYMVPSAEANRGPFLDAMKGIVS